MPISEPSHHPLATDPHSSAGSINNPLSTTQYGSPSNTASVPFSQGEEPKSSTSDNGDTNSTSRTSILKLPPEVLLHAISFLDPRDIAISERVCKTWFDTCRDDACWRTAFFARFDAATAPGRRLTGNKSTWKAEYLFRAKTLRMWAKSSAKSRVADLKLSHITNLELLPQGGALVASTWSGRGQTLSPATLKASKFSMLPDNNLVDEVISCVSNPEYIFWATHMQICAIDLSFKSSTRLLDQSMGSIAALAAVQGRGQHALLAVAFLSGRLAVYDAVACSKVWQTSEEQRLMDEDQVPLTVKAVVANAHHLVAATEHGLYFFTYHPQHEAKSQWNVRLEGRLNYVALESSDVLVHEHEEPSLKRFAQGQLVKRYASNSDRAITAVTYDFAFPPNKTSPYTTDFGHQKFLAAGRADGSVDVWLWNAEDAGHGSIQPARTFHPDSKQDEMRVTALACSDILLFAGYLDGSIRAYDFLTGQIVRVFNEQSTPRHALRQVLQGMTDDRRWMVSRIVANDRTVYASVGERFWTWTCTEAVMTKKKKRRGPRLSSRAERYQDEVDMENDLLDYEAETSPRREHNRRPQFSLESLLSPDEAIQYAQLLSVEAEEERRTRLAEQYVEMDFDLEELLALDGMQDTQYDTAAAASPVVSDQDFDDFYEGSYTLGTSAASPQTISDSRSPYLSPQLQSRDSDGFRSFSDAALSASLDDQSHFPSLATSPVRTSNYLQQSPPTPSTPSAMGNASRPTGGWSSILGKSSTSPASASSPLSSSPAPFARAVPGSSSTATRPASGEEEDDPDLKLAIQLSLLETRGSP